MSNLVPVPRHAARERTGLAALVAERGLVLAAAIGLLFVMWSGHWVILPATLALWAFWRWLPTDCGPPGIPAAFSYHLLQIVGGVYFVAWTGRQLQPMMAPSYRLMMWLGLASVMAIAAGFYLGYRWIVRRRPIIVHARLQASTGSFLVAYIVGLAVTQGLRGVAFDYPAFAQGIVALSTVQLGLLYLVLRRLFAEDRVPLALAIVAFEVARGFTGFYADFKEPVMAALVAMAEVFRPKRAAHWILTALLVAAVLAAGVVWISVRGSVREDIQAGSSRTASERLAFVMEEARAWWRLEPEYKLASVDLLVERMWDIYYTALALDRVPSVLPHEHGAQLWTAIQHVLTPRFLNPDKPELESESELVRRYTGLAVAGREQGTTIAFGYVIQSYIDFGVPLMFLPPLVWGLLLGASYGFFVVRLHHEEILLPVLAAGFWFVIMLYNVTWAKWMGKFLTGAVYIGVLALILDHYLVAREQRLGRVAASQPAATS